MRSSINITYFPISGTNIGSGEGVFQGINPVNTLNFKKFQGAGGITISGDTDTIIFSGGTSTGSTNVTANNGLTKSGDNIRLGGTLTGNTIINYNNNSLNLSGSTLLFNSSGRTNTLKNNSEIVRLASAISGDSVTSFFFDINNNSLPPHPISDYLYYYDDISFFDHKYFIVTNGGGLYYYNEGLFESKIYSSSSGNYSGDQYYDDSFKIAFDPNNNIVYSIFYNNNGFSALDIVNDVNTFYSPTSGNYSGDLLPTGVSSTYRQIYYDTTTNNIWLNVITGGLVRFDLDTNTSTLYTSTSGNYTGDTFTNTGFNSNVISVNGDIWIPTSVGLYRFREATSGMTLFTSTSGNYSGDVLPTNSLNSTIKPIIDNDGILWFVNVNNLWSLNPVTLSATAYTSTSGNYTGDLFNTPIFELNYAQERNEIYYRTQTNSIGYFNITNKINKRFTKIIGYKGGTQFRILGAFNASETLLSLVGTNTLVAPLSSPLYSLTYPSPSPVNLKFDEYGLVYTSDVSNLFDDQNIITKKYVEDNREIFTNGLTRDSIVNKNVKLGGIFTENTTISGATRTLSLGTTGSRLSNFNASLVDVINFNISGNNNILMGKSNSLTGSATVDNNFIVGHLNVISGGSGNTRWNTITGEENRIINVGASSGVVIHNAALVGGFNNEIRNTASFSVFNPVILGGANNVIEPNGENISQAFIMGRNSRVEKPYGIAIGYKANATGFGSFVHSITNSATFSTDSGEQPVIASGRHAINISSNSTAQTASHGAHANYSVILGGYDHNIPSNSHRSVILGGESIKVSSGVTNTVHLPKVRIGQGNNATIATNNANTNILSLNPSTNEIEIRESSTLGGSGSTTVTANNGLTKSGDNIRLGGVLTGDTLITGNGTQNLELGTFFDKLNRFQSHVDNNIYLETDSGTNNSYLDISADSTTLGNNLYGSIAIEQDFLSIQSLSTDGVRIDGRNSSNVTGTRLLLGYNSAVFRDFRTGTTAVGLQYHANYSANFTLRSLVDKEYVDTQISLISGNTGSTNVTANNGLTKSGDNIRLGGTLTGDTTININNNVLTIQADNNVNTESKIKIGVVSGSSSVFLRGNYNTIGGVGVDILAESDDTSNSAIIAASVDLNGLATILLRGDNGITFVGGDMVVELTSGSTFEYNDNYAAQFTPRSFVDKQYVDDKFYDIERQFKFNSDFIAFNSDGNAEGFSVTSSAVTTSIGIPSGFNVYGVIGLLNINLNNASGAYYSLHRSNATGIVFGNGFECDIKSRLYTAIGGAGNDYILKFGFVRNISTTSSQDDGAYFYYRYNENGGRWIATTMRNGTATTGDTGVAIINTDFVRLQIIVNEDGDEVRFYVNNTLTNTITTNIPTNAAVDAMGNGFYIERVAGGGSLAIAIDYYEEIFTRTTDRS